MTRLRSVSIAVAIAVRRLSVRPLAALMLFAALACAGGLIGWGSLAGALSSEDNVRIRLAELPSDERALQAIYNLQPGERDPLAPKVNRFFAMFRDVTRAPRRVRVWHSIGPGIRLVAPENVVRDVIVTQGRLPKGCGLRTCEALVLAGDFRVGQRVPLGSRASARVVGAGVVRHEALPRDSEALPRTPDLSSRTLLVRAPGPPLRLLVRDTGTSVAVTAALDPDAVHASELRALVERLREESVRIRRDTVRVEARAPFELLDDIADRGDVARIRLVLVAGQAAALILAFASYAAAARRRESALHDEQLDTLGASPFQMRLARIVEVALPCAAGAVVALAGLYLGALLVARARDLPASFVAAAVPWWTVVTVLVATGVAVVLLVATQGPGERRRGIGALELAAVTALAVVIWQTATTGALDPERIEEGGGVGPVLVLLPVLAFFTAGVVVLRLLPLVLRRAERISRRASLAVRLGFLSAARRPGEAAAATTFLAVALGAALFGLNYRLTLERQARDEARFTVGAQWRVTESSAPDESALPSTRPRVGADVQPPSGAEVKPVTGQVDVTPLSRYASATSERATPVLRLFGGVTEAAITREELPVEVLALPAARISALLGWQGDFSTQSLEAIERTLAPRRAGFGLRLAPDARELRAWIRSNADLTRFVVLHFFLPDQQRFVHLGGPIASSEWRRMRFRLPAAVRGAALVGVEFAPVSVPLSAPPDLGVIEIAGFEQRGLGAWAPLGPIEEWVASSAGGEAEVAEYGGEPVRRRLQFALQGTASALIRPLVPEEVLPAFVSGRVAGAAVDGIVTVHGVSKDVQLRVVGRATLFPTVIEHPRAFVVVDYESLFVLLNADYPGVALPTEAWFFQPQRPDFLERLAQAPFRVESVVGVEPLTARLVNDPLGSGARDVLLIASVVAALLGLLGIALSARSALGAERLVLAEYEALGVLPTTIARSLQLRLLVLSALGVVAGFLGALLAVRLVGAGVAVTGAAGAPLPPIEPVVAWQTGAILVGVLGGAALVAAFLLASRAMRETAATRLRA